MSDHSSLDRENFVPIVFRHHPKNLTRNLFGGNSLKTKICITCNNYFPYANFYVRSYCQHIDKGDLEEKHLRGSCIRCFDENVKVKRKLKKNGKSQTDSIDANTLISIL